MKKYLVFLFISFTPVCYLMIQAQSIQPVDNDSLTYFFETKDFVKYFIKITELCDSAYAASDKEQLTLLSENLKKDFSNLDSLQKKGLRNCAMIVGHLIRMLSGNYN